MICATPGCIAQVPPSQGTKPREYCDECSTPAARKARTRAGKPQCCQHAAGYRCPQHQVSQGHQAGDRRRWWMPPYVERQWLHQYAQVEFPRSDGVDNADERNRDAARAWAKQFYGSMATWFQTEPGAQAPERLKDTPAPKAGEPTPHPDAKLWEEKLDYKHGRGFVNPNSPEVLEGKRNDDDEREAALDDAQLDIGADVLVHTFNQYDVLGYDSAPYARATWGDRIGEPGTYPKDADWTVAFRFMRPVVAQELVDLDQARRHLKPSVYYARRDAILAEHKITKEQL